MLSWRGLDPRRHLAAAIGWTVFAVVMLAAVAAANLAASAAERSARIDAQALLGELATQAQRMLSARLETYRLVIQAAADQIVASNDRGGEALRRHLEALQAQLTEFVWLGVADDRGRVIAGTGGRQEGDNVSALVWFGVGAHGRLGLVPFVVTIASDPARVIDLAAPLVNPAGGRVGTLGGYLSWAWIERMQSEMLQVLDAQRGLELLLITADGEVLVGPAAWVGRKLGPGTDLSESGAYVVGRALEAPGAEAGAAWTQVVRQPVASALSGARAAHRAVFAVVFLAGLLAAFAAVIVTHALTRRLATLAADTEAVRQGERPSLAVIAGDDEVSRIGEALARVVDHLQQERQALAGLNRDLDARVTERTARIEALAEVARHAAVTRERLRLARDLHDTLAHSLMALLTQIRLVRKLRSRLDAGELDAELARAEEVATTGLTEARAAITQMRSSGVRESGLGAALQELLARFGERTGIATTFQADAAAGELTDERTEVLFRMAEEALRNVERHAQAQQVHIGLTWQAGTQRDAPAERARVTLSIADDGVGLDAAAATPGHFGLQGLQEQAGLIGAAFELHSEPGAGTRIVIAFDD